MDYEGIKDYIEVKPGIYTGGQPTADQIIQLGKAGFNILINLATATSPNALPNEQELSPLRRDGLRPHPR